jgi:hypothetical protein
MSRSGLPVTLASRGGQTHVRVLAEGQIPQQDKTIELFVDGQPEALKNLCWSIAMYGKCKGYEVNELGQVYQALQFLFFKAVTGDYTPIVNAPEFIWEIFNAMRPRRVDHRGTIYSYKFNPKSLSPTTKMYVGNCHAGALREGFPSVEGLLTVVTDNPFIDEQEMNSILSRFFAHISQKFSLVGYSAKYDVHGADAYAWKVLTVENAADNTKSGYGVANLETKITGWLAYIGLGSDIFSGFPTKRLPMFSRPCQGNGANHCGVRMFLGPEGFSSKYRDFNANLKFFDVTATCYQILYALSRVRTKGIEAGRPDDQFGAFLPKAYSDDVAPQTYLSAIYYLIRSNFDAFDYTWGGTIDQLAAIASGTVGANPFTFSQYMLPSFVVEAMRSQRPTVNIQRERFEIIVPAATSDLAPSWLSLASVWGWEGINAAPSPIVIGNIDLQNMYSANDPTYPVLTLFRSPTNLTPISTVLNYASQVDQQFSGYNPMQVVSSQPHPPEMTQMLYTTVLSPSNLNVDAQKFLEKMLAWYSPLFTGSSKKLSSAVKEWICRFLRPDCGPGPQALPPWYKFSFNTLLCSINGVINETWFSSAFSFDGQLILPITLVPAGYVQRAIEFVKQKNQAPWSLDSSDPDGPYAVTKLIVVDGCVQNPTNDVLSETGKIIRNRSDQGIGGAIANLGGNNRFMRAIDKIADMIPGTRRINNNPAAMKAASLGNKQVRVRRDAKQQVRQAGGSKKQARRAAGKAGRRNLGTAGIDELTRRMSDAKW